jgi:hypothetical protein
MLLRYARVVASLVAMAVVLAMCVLAGAASIADHVVISEVEVVDSEWAELYNPTDDAVNMSSWYWCYYESSRDWNQPSRKKAFVDCYVNSSIIEVHRCYLMRIYGTVPNNDWDAKLIGSPNKLNDSAGSVAIFPWDPAGKTAEEAEAGRIDAVAWGAVNYVKEGSEAPAPGSGMSLQRRVNEMVTNDGVHGPGWDTDTNAADFFIATPDPRSSGYAPVPPIPELEPLILFATGLCALACYMLIAQRRAR